MAKTTGAAWIAAFSLVALLVFGATLSSQSGLPNPYRPVRGLADGGGLMVPGGDWARLPGGREMGPPASMHVDIDGESIWAFIRCDETNPVSVANGGRFGIDCLDKSGKIKNIDTIYKFDAKGNVVRSFGAGMFIWPHGLHVDREGNVWATDGASQDAVAMAAKAGGRFGHQVIKFSPDGKVLMRLGEAGVPGSDQNHFISPSAVAVGGEWRHLRRRRPRCEREQPCRQVFQRRQVHQGVGKEPATRQVSFERCMGSRSIRAAACSWPTAETIEFRSSIRKGNIWRHGCSSGHRVESPSTTRIRYIVADSESDNVTNPGWEQGIRIGDARTGWVTAFILDYGGDPRTVTGSGPEFVTVDRAGNVFGGEPRPRVLRKYVKVR